MFNLQEFKVSILLYISSGSYLHASCGCANHFQSPEITNPEQVLRIFFVKLPLFVASSLQCDGALSAHIPYDFDKAELRLAEVSMMDMGRKDLQI